MAVRECVGYYLFTHQLMEVTGEEANKFLDYVFPNNIATLAVGRDRYTTMLNEDGEIIDDVVVMRMDEDRYWVSTLYGTKADDWFYYKSEGYDVETYEITEDWHMFSIQGPKSKEVLNSILSNGVDDLKFFQNRTDEINGIEVIVNRTEDFTQGFIDCLEKVDKVYLTEIDSNRERQEDYPGVSSRMITDGIEGAEIINENDVSVLDVRKGDVLLVMSCASVSHLLENIENRYNKKD